MLKEMETWQPDDEKVSSSIVPSPDDDDELTMGPKFKVSDIVDVMPRLWAGINKPGGAARITYVNYDQEEDEYTYNVSYIIHSGSEQKVEGIYINKLDQEDGPQKKVRSVRGRCRWCICFVKDCSHNQDVNPFAVEEPVFDITTGRRPDGDHHRTSMKRKQVDSAQAYGCGDEMEDLYFNIVDVEGGGSPVGGTLSRKRQGDKMLRKSRRKRHRGSSNSARKLTRKVLKAQRKKYVAPLVTKDYQQLLSAQFLSAQCEEHSNLTSLPADRDGTVAMLPVGDFIDSSAAVNSEQASANSIARANRVGIIRIEDSDDEESDNERTVLAVHSPVQVEEDHAVATLAFSQAGVANVQAAQVAGAVQPTTASGSVKNLPPPSHVSVPKPNSGSDGLAVEQRHQLQVAVPVSASVPERSSSLSAAVQSHPPSQKQSQPQVQPQPQPQRSDSTLSRSSTVSTAPGSAPYVSKAEALAFTSELHAQILQSCCEERRSAGGDADDDDDFINNAANSHKDSDAAQVNAVYNGLIDSLKVLSRDQKVSLFLHTFDWMVQNIDQKDEFLPRLVRLEQRLQQAVPDSYMLHALSDREQRELEAVTDAFADLVDEQDVYFKRIERAGFEVLLRLRHTASSRIKKKMVVVNCWPVGVKEVKSTLLKRIRTFEDAYEKAVALFDDFEERSSEDSEDSDGSTASGGSRFSRGSDYSSGSRRALSAPGRVRDAAKEAGTIVRKHSGQRGHQQDSEEDDDGDRDDNRAPRRSHGASSKSKPVRSTHNHHPHHHSTAGGSSSAVGSSSLARAGSHGNAYSTGSTGAAEQRGTLHRNERNGRKISSAASAGAAASSSHPPKRARTREEEAQPGTHFSADYDDDSRVHDGGYEDDFSDHGGYGFGDDLTSQAIDVFASDSSDSDPDSDRDREGEVGRSQGSRRKSRDTRPPRYRQYVPSAGNKTSHGSNATSSTADGDARWKGGSRQRTSSRSTQFEREVEQVFGPPPRDRSDQPKAAGSSSRNNRHPFAAANAGEGSRKGRKNAGAEVEQHYYRRRVPTVADLPAHVRYHGRVVVLEGLLSVPAGASIVSGSNSSLPGITLDGDRAQQHRAIASLSQFGRSGQVALSAPSTDKLPLTSRAVVGANLSFPEQGAPDKTSRSIHPSFPSALTGRGEAPINRAATEDIDEVDGEGASEDLVDLVLSAMANPFASDPPLHTQQPFYQVGRHGGVLTSSVSETEVMLKAWAATFLARLAELSTLAPSASGAAHGVVADKSAVAQFSAATQASVSEILHKLTTYRQLEQRCSVLQSSQCLGNSSTTAELQQRRRTELIAAQFQRKETWTALVSFSTGKLTKINYLMREGLVRWSASASAATNRAESLTQVLQRCFGVLERRLYAHLSSVCEPKSSLPDNATFRRSDAGASSGDSKPAELFVPTCLAGFLYNALSEELHTHKCDELAVYLQLSLLRCKVSALVESALCTVDAAKLRQPVVVSDKAAIAQRSEEEKADWEVMNRCFAELLVVQDSAVAALLWNKRILLGVLYHLSVHSNRTAAAAGGASPNNEASADDGVEFKRGISCTIRMFAALLFEVFRALRNLHSKINSARISSNGSASGSRVWACYDASREQVNGPIATYNKNVWTGIITTVCTTISRSRMSLFHPHVHGSVNGNLTPELSKLSLIGSVNPSIWSASEGKSSEERGVNSSSEPGADVLWGVLTVISHFLRTVTAPANITTVTSAFSADATTDAEASTTRAAVRVDGGWGILRGLADAAVTNLCTAGHSTGGPAPGNLFNKDLTGQLLGILRRVSLFAAVWTDSPSEAPALYLSILSQSAVAFGALLPVIPMHKPLLDIKPTDNNGRSAHAGVSAEPAGTLDAKSGLLLCFHAYFSFPKVLPNGHSTSGGSCWGESNRSDLHRQLLYVVSLLFKACGVPNPHAGAGNSKIQTIDSLLTSDPAGEFLAAQNEESLRVIHQIRRTFKALLYNACTESCGPADAAGVSANIAAIKSAALKAPKIFAKTTLMALLSKNPSSATSFQSSLLLSLMVTELTAFYGQDVVRNKLKIAAPVSNVVGPLPVPIKDTPLPLQEQVMNAILSRVTGDVAAAALAANGTNTGANTTTPASTVSMAAQIEQLLQQVPLNQQQQQQRGASINSHTDGQALTTGGNAATDKAVAMAESAQRSSSLCLLAFVGLLTLLPFPVDGHTGIRIIPYDVAHIKEADIKRILDTHRADAQYLEPTLQVLRFVSKLHADRTLSQQDLVLLMSLLGTALNTCASLLRHLNTISVAECTIPLRCGATELAQPWVSLYAPLVKEMIDIVQSCMFQSIGSKARDGLHVSAIFVTGLLVQFLTNWRRQHTALNAAAATASNAEPAALTLLQRWATEDLAQYHELIALLLHVPPTLAAAVPYPRTSAVPTPTSAGKGTGSELVITLKSHLLFLTSSLKSQEVSALDFSSSLGTADGPFDASQMRRLKARKLNTAAGASFTVCKVLGDLTAMILNAAADVQGNSNQINVTLPVGRPSNPAIHTVSFAQTLIAEVLDCLERINTAATKGSANMMLGVWLRVVFWEPVLRCISAICCGGGASAIAQDMPGLLQPHIPSLLSDWCSCVMLKDSTVTTRNVSGHIQLSEYCNHLTSLCVVMVLAVNCAFDFVGMTKLSSVELQCWRLCELFQQICEVNASDTSMDKRDKVVQFLRLLASGGTSTVLAELMVVSKVSAGATAGPNSTSAPGAVARSFPSAHRTAFESVNILFIKELCRCLQCLNMFVFRSPDPKDKARLKDLIAELKALVADCGYLARSLQHYPQLLARVTLPSGYGGVYGSIGAQGGSTPVMDSQPLTAQVLRGVNQLPSTVPLDLATSFLMDSVEPDVIALISGMFQYVLCEHIRSNDASSTGTGTGNDQKGAVSALGAAAEVSLQALQEETERALLCNLPRYILMTSGTPYSTRLTAWRRLLVPIFMSSTYCTAGRATDNKEFENVLLSERTMDDIPYFLLLVWALTLALPLPERLVQLVPVLQADSANNLRTEFAELVCVHLKIPVKNSTLWKVFKIMASIVRTISTTEHNTTTAPGAYSGGDGGGSDTLTKQDPQLSRFRQFLLLSSSGSASAVSTGMLSSASIKSGSSSSVISGICSQRNALWETLQQEAQSALNRRVTEEQGKLAIQANKFAHTSTAKVMTVLPWAAVRTSLHLHVTAFDAALHALIDRHCHGGSRSGSGSGSGSAANTVENAVPASVSEPDHQRATAVPSSAIASLAQVSAEKEEMLCLVVTSAVHMVRVALTSAEVHQARTQLRHVMDSTRQRLLLLLQLCRLSAAAAMSQHQYLHQHLCAANANAEAATPESAIVRAWGKMVQALRTLLNAAPPVSPDSCSEAQGSLCAFKDSCMQLLGEFFKYGNCSRATQVQNILQSASQKGSECRCALCVTASSPATSTAASTELAADVSRTEHCIHTLVHYVSLLDVAVAVSEMNVSNISGTLQVVDISTEDICKDLEVFIV